MPTPALIALAIITTLGCIPMEPEPAAPDRPPVYGERGGGPPGEVVGDPASTPAPPHAAPPAPTPTPSPAPAQTPVAAKDPMRVLEAQIIVAMNQLRANPKAFADEIRTYRSYYREDLIHFPGREVAIMTNEGVAAVDEAIKAALAASPAKRLGVSAGLTRAAVEHAVEVGGAGHINHTSSDGSQPHHRMERYGSIVGYSGENIATGDTTGLHMVIGLFVDDGVPSRGHRTNLLTKAFGAVGVGCSPHIQWEVVCVIDYAEGYRERR